MKRLRLTVAGLMALVAYLAVGLAALRSPSPAWVTASTTLTLGLLIGAALGGLYGGPGVRPFWGGAAVAGLTYLATASTPWFGPQLATTRLADAAYNRLAYVPSRPGETVWIFLPDWSRRPVFAEGEFMQMDTTTLGVKHYRVLVEINGKEFVESTNPNALRPISQDAYRILWHSLLCPLVACLGGLVARLLASARPRDARARIVPSNGDAGPDPVGLADVPVADE